MAEIAVFDAYGTLFDVTAPRRAAPSPVRAGFAPLWPRSRG
jgi:FMN phosphatase YigB (HAD superfamily)